MWTVAQKGCWAPAKGPHKGSQIVSLQCKYDDSGGRGSLVVQPPSPLPCSPSPVLVLGEYTYWEGGHQAHWLQRDLGRRAAFTAQSSHLRDFGTGLVASQVPYWPFTSGVFGVWLVARVGRTVRRMRPQHNFQQNLSSLCPNEGTGRSWGRSTRGAVRSTRGAVRSPLRGEGPTEKLPSPVWARAAPQARIPAGHPAHKVWQSWGRGRLERARKENYESWATRRGRWQRQQRNQDWGAWKNVTHCLQGKWDSMRSSDMRKVGNSDAVGSRRRIYCRINGLMQSWVCNDWRIWVGIPVLYRQIWCAFFFKFLLCWH